MVERFPHTAIIEGPDGTTIKGEFVKQTPETVVIKGRLVMILGPTKTIGTDSDRKEYSAKFIASQPVQFDPKKVTVQGHTYEVVHVLPLQLRKVILLK